MITYLLIMNAASLLLMSLDKKYARQHRWRIPEVVLLAFAALGGSLGTLLGMVLCHHKTRHPAFFITVPLLLAIHLALILLGIVPLQ